MVKQVTHNSVEKVKLFVAFPKDRDKRVLGRQEEDGGDLRHAERQADVSDAPPCLKAK